MGAQSPLDSSSIAGYGLDAPPAQRSTVRRPGRPVRAGQRSLLTAGPRSGAWVCEMLRMMSDDCLGKGEAAPAKACCRKTALGDVEGSVTGDLFRQGHLLNQRVNTSARVETEACMLVAVCTRIRDEAVSFIGWSFYTGSVGSNTYQSRSRLCGHQPQVSRASSSRTWTACRASRDAARSRR